MKLPIDFSPSSILLATRASELPLNFDGFFDIARTDEWTKHDFLRIGISGVSNCVWRDATHIVLLRCPIFFDFVGSTGDGCAKTASCLTPLSISSNRAVINKRIYICKCHRCNFVCHFLDQSLLTWH